MPDDNVPSNEEFEKMLQEIGPEKMDWMSSMSAPEGPHEVDEEGDII
jgi:hypothetical protein